MNAIAEYNSTRAALAELASRYKGVVFDVRSEEGLEAAKAAAKELRTYRLDLETMRETIKRPALERCNAIDAEAREIKAQLEELEKPIAAQVKAENERREAEKAAAKAREEARKQGHRDHIASIKAMPEKLAQASPAEIKAALDALESSAYNAEEFEASYLIEISQTEAKLALLHREAVAREEHEAAERSRRLAEKAELEKLRAEAQARKLAEEEEAKIRAEQEAKRRAAIDAEERAARARIAAAEEEARKRIEADHAAVLAERARVVAEEAAARAKLEEERREVERAALELKDGRAVLQAFVDRFGRRKEFAAIVAAIRQFLEAQGVRP